MSGARGYIPPFTYQNVLVSAGVVQSQPNIQVGAAVGGTIMLGPDAVEGFSLLNQWNQLAADGQTLAATITIEVTNDPAAHPNSDDQANAVWYDLTSQVTLVNPTSGAGKDMIMVSDVRFEFLRQSISGLTGSGRFVSIFSAHGT